MAKKKEAETEEAPKAGLTTAKNFDFFNKIKTNNVYAENKDKFETRTFIDTGCFVLNALLSGDLLGGYPSNRVIMLAGEEAVGKSLFTTMSFVRPGFKAGRYTFYIDTENAVEDENLTQYGIDENAFKILKCPTVEETRESMIKILNDVKKRADEATCSAEIPKALFVMDSQGNLTTRKSIEKSLEGETTKDMTKQQEIKRLYAETVTTMGMLDIPFIVTNHVYQNVGGYGDPKKIAGGSGGLYNASIILMLTKSKEVEGSGENRVRVGSVISAKVVKSRFVMPDLVGKFYLDFKKGINPWYGLHEFAAKAGLLEIYSESVHGKLGVVKPVGLGQGEKYVLRNPNTDPSTWVVCNKKTLHKKEGIGTIFDPLNEWVKENFKLKTPIGLSLDDEAMVEDTVDD